MKMRQLFRATSIVVVLCGIFVHLASAQDPAAEPRRIYPLQALTCPNTLLRGCCRVYCPKPIPCIKAFCRDCCKDGFCSKPCPCIPCFDRAGTSYCYCNKPCPDLCRPIASDYFTCVEKNTGCAAIGPGHPIEPNSSANTPTGHSHYEATEVQPAPALLNYSN
jgi:hypothetical protein